MDIKRFFALRILNWKKCYNNYGFFVSFIATLIFLSIANLILGDMTGFIANSILLYVVFSWPYHLEDLDKTIDTYLVPFYTKIKDGINDYSESIEKEAANEHDKTDESSNVKSTADDRKETHIDDDQATPNKKPKSPKNIKP